MNTADQPFPTAEVALENPPTLRDAALSQRAWVPELAGFEDVPYFGHVESLTSKAGLIGWAAGLDPMQPVTVALTAGGVEIARTRASVSRNDIWHHNQVDFFTGFSFELEDMLPLLAMTDLSPAEPIAICIADTFYGLTLAKTWTVGDLVALLQADRVDPADAAVEASIANLPTGIALARLTRRANRLLGRVRRNDRTQSSGTIEFIGALSDEFLILGGWWPKAQALACSAVLVSNQQKSPAALLALTLPRADLDDSHCGFVGLLQVQGGLVLPDGQPQFTLSLGESQTVGLSTLRGLRMLTPEAALAELCRVADMSATPRSIALAAQAREVQPWIRPPAADGLGISIGIDSFYVAPGFGVMVSGWVLSALGVLTDLAVQVGGTTCMLDPATLSLAARPDLATAVPHMADRVRYAGFSGVLRGSGHLDVSRRWLLRLKFSDQSTVFFDVPMDRARVIDGDFDLTPLGDLRFGLTDAPWLSEFADAVYGATVEPEGLRTVAGERQTPQAVVIQALPASTHGLRLALDQIGLQAPVWEEAGIGLVLLLPKQVPVGLVQTWLAHFAATWPSLSLRLAFTPPGRNAWQVLPSLIDRVNADRFGFTGPDVLLTLEGAHAMAKSLEVNPHLPVFLAVEYLAGGAHLRVSHEAQAFAWTRPGFKKFRSDSKAIIDGFFRTNGLDAFEGSVKLEAANGPHALRLQPSPTGTLPQRLNVRLLQA